MPLARVRDVCLLGGLGLALFGLIRTALPWAQLAPRALDAAVLAVAVLAVGVAASKLLSRPLALTVTLSGLGIGALAFAGFASTAATVLVMLAGMALGTLLPRNAGVDPLVRWVAGMGLLAATTGWLLPLPVHRAPVWAVAMLVLVLLRWRAVREDVQTVGEGLGASVRVAPLASALWAVVLMVASAPAWLPLGNADDLAYHLTIGSEFLRYGHGRMDIGAQAWALAPWSTDLLHALVTVLGGRDGTGPLNSLWLLVTSLLIRALGAAMGLSAGRAWLAAMLYTSLPLTSFLTGSLQTEPATAAMLVALALTLAGDSESRGQRLTIIATLAGFMLAAKISNALLLLPFFVWLIVSWRRCFPWRWLPLATALGIFAGGSSYVYGAVLTGSPVVPMLNGYFRTPWFPPENFVDQTWQTGIGWRALWDLVFDSSRYFEGTAGAAGLVLIALIGGIVPALASSKARVPLLVSLAALLLVFIQVQYLRYIHPAIAVLVPALVAGLLPGSARWGWREFAVTAVVLLQLLLIPTSSWILSGGALRILMTEGRQAVSDRFVPERAVTARFRASASPTDRLLFVDPQRSHGGELPGLSVGTAWFTPLVARLRVGSPQAPETWAAIVERTGANHVLVYDLPAWPAVSTYLASRDAVRVDANGAAELYWLPPPGAHAAAEGPPSPATDGQEDKVDATAAAPQAAPAVQSSAAGIPVSAAEIGLGLSVDRPHPVLGQAVVRLGCSIPGEPIAVAWTLPAVPMQPIGHWEWVTCGPSKQAVAAVQFQVGPHAGELRFNAKPARPGSGLILERNSAVVDVRRDYHVETALYRWLWRCPGDRCDNDPPRLLPLASGQLTY